MPERTAALEHAAQQLAGVRDDLAALSTSIDKLASKGDVRGVVAAQKSESKGRKRWNWIIAVALAVGFALAVTNIIVALNVLGQSNSNGDQLTAIQHLSRQTGITNDLLIECTTPSIPGDTHECYEAQVAQYATQTGDLVAAAIATSACTDLPGSQPIGDIRKCVQRILGSSSG